MGAAGALLPAGAVPCFWDCLLLCLRLGAGVRDAAVVETVGVDFSRGKAGSDVVPVGVFPTIAACLSRMF